MNPLSKDTTLRSAISQVQLGKTDQVVGTIFRKQIMSYGQWVNPNWWFDEEFWMELSEDIADQMIENFNKKTHGKRVSVPLNHTGDVTANAGEVMKLEKGPGGMWAYLDIRDERALDKINKGLVFDVSMGFDWDYVSQKDGKHYGPTLIHVALVTDPYLNDMDDFQKTDNLELSKRFDEFAENTGFGKLQPSIIMMSKDKVEELRRMKFSKITNDKEYPVEVTYTDAEGNEQKKTLEAGAELEVPTEQGQAVTDQVNSAEKPADENQETDEDKQAREAKEAADREAEEKREQEAEEERKKNESKDEQLSRVMAENAALKAEKDYQTLLAKGKITPAQKDLFMALAKQGAVTLSTDVKSLNLSKGQSTSVTSLLSAILGAGPDYVKFGEKGAGGEKKVELSKEDEAKIVKMGFNPGTFKKQLKAGTITMEDIE